jgi:ubiquinol-cytochrome c reductase cytochrome b subunit
MSAKNRPITSILVNIAMWLERRLHIVKIWNATGGHPIPKSSASWFYTFGSMTLLCFSIQIITGILLALVYVPSAVGCCAPCTIGDLTAWLSSCFYI